jgi:hypothetical protein
MGVWRYNSTILALDAGEWTASRSYHFNTEKELPVRFGYEAVWFFWEVMGLERGPLSLVKII